MYEVERHFLKTAYEQYQIEGPDCECRKLCAVNDLTADNSFSACQHCIFMENIDSNLFSEETTLCNRYIDLCCI